MLSPSPAADSSGASGPAADSSGAGARDAGVTLVELLVAVSILGVLLAATTGITFVAARTATTADTRLDESNDLLRAATYFGDDVQGAQSVAAGTTPRCGTDPTAVVELVGQDFADDSSFATSTTVVAYVLRTTAGRRELHRTCRWCSPCRPPRRRWSAAAAAPPSPGST